MAITYPLSLAALADRLEIKSVTWDIHRSDELSGTGDARVWQAEMASPLWTGDVGLGIGYHNEVKQIAAIIRKLHGAQESFYIFDPLSPFPQADPDGSILGASVVLVASIGANNQSLSLKGLPPGYVLTLGDKGQAVYLAGARNFFFEVSETITADGTTGVTPEFDIFPHVPVGLAVDDPVTLIKPACKVFIMPGSSNPGSASGTITEGAAFKVMERKR